MMSIDILTVFFASAIYMIIYVVWYSKFLFGKFFKNHTKKRSFFNYLTVYFSILFFCYVLALFEVIFSITNFWDGMFFGFLIWAGIFVTHAIINGITHKIDKRVVLIDNFLYLIGTMFCAAIIAG